MKDMLFPRFNEARGETASMQLTPPFQFTGVTMRVFPLRVNRYLLQRFIDQHLNIIPPAAGQFSVFLPYLYLIVVNYGKMAVQAANLGWISQNEVAFSVPLIWRHEVEGRVVQDFAYVSPFIYVDNPLSMTTGREVYGWPKMMASFDPQLSAWMASPTNRVQQASMSVDMIRTAYSGARSERCTLLEIDAAPAPTFTTVPFNINHPLLPWNLARQSVRTSAALFNDSVQMFRGMLEQFVSGSGRELAADQARRTLGDPSMLTILNTVNLKQFRDAEQPSHIAYQAVTNTQMTMKSFRRGGMLGDVRILAGDVTGGYRVRIHNYDTQPIVATLGLEVANQSQIEGVDVSNLHPVYPFWIELDLDYPLAQILAWRHRGSKRWFCDDAQPQTESNELFDTARGAGSPEIAGPYQFPDATVRVLPLLADPTKLQAFVDGYLNATLAGTESHFEAWGRYVYVIVQTDDAAFSESNNVGNLATRSLDVMVPVKRYVQTAAGKQLVATALVPVYAYANSAAAAISSSSVNGVPTMTCELDSPPNSWLEHCGAAPDADDYFMTLRGEVLPVLGLGQEAQTRTIIDCHNIEPFADDDVEGWRLLGDQWAPRLKQELARKRELADEPLRDAKTLALELLANRASFQYLTLKQFRSAADPKQACYQAFVEIPTRIEQLYQLEEIEGSVHVRIHEYPSQAIVTTLGIEVKSWQRGTGSEVAVIEPCRPFWFRARIRQELGTNLHVWTLTREGTPGWSAAPTRATLLGAPKLGPSLVDEIDDGNPQYLAGRVTRWLGEGKPTLTPERALAAVEAVEPQQVIESMLSCEWEARHAPRWRRGQQTIVARIEAANASAFPSEITANTGMLLRDTFEQLRKLEQGLFGFETRRTRAVDDDLHEYRALATLLCEVQEADEHLRTLTAIGGQAANEAPQILSDMAVSFALPQPGGAQPDSTGHIETVKGKRRAAEAALLRHLDKLRAEPSAPSADAIGGMPSFSLPVPGGPIPAPDTMPTEFVNRLRGTLDRVLAVSEHGDGSLPDQLRGELIVELKGGLLQLRDRIIEKLAKSWQKPDGCIRRQTVLNDGMDRHFPLNESFDENWYAGPR
jgi:hypothetical protein